MPNSLEGPVMVKEGLENHLITGSQSYGLHSFSNAHLVSDKETPLLTQPKLNALLLEGHQCFAKGLWDRTESSLDLLKSCSLH